MIITYLEVAAYSPLLKALYGVCSDFSLLYETHSIYDLRMEMDRVWCEYSNSIPIPVFLMGIESYPSGINSCMCPYPTGIDAWWIPIGHINIFFLRVAA